MGEPRGDPQRRQLQQQRSGHRRPHGRIPGLNAIKYVYRYLHGTPIDLATAGSSVKNWFDFLNTRDVVEGYWSITANGTPLASGTLGPLDLEPRDTREIRIPMPQIRPDPGVEYWLNLRFALKGDTLWAKKGDEIGWEQWKLPVSAPAVAPPAAAAPLRANQSGNQIRFAGPEFAMVFDRVLGHITSYTFRGMPLLDRGPLPDFWRAITDNDWGAWKSIVNAARKDPGIDITVWRTAGAAWRVQDVQMKRIDDSSAQVDVVGELPPVGAKYTMSYLIQSDGRVTVTVSYEPGTTAVAMMPRFGTELVMSPGFERLVWYGRGPDETYVDRQFAPVGIYSSTVSDAVGGLLTSTGERQQDRRALGVADQRAGHRAPRPRAAASQRQRVALHEGGARARRVLGTS